MKFVIQECSSWILFYRKRSSETSEKEVEVFLEETKCLIFECIVIDEALEKYPTSEVIENFFKGFGDLVKFHRDIMLDGTPVASGYVVFKTIEAADKAFAAPAFNDGQIQLKLRRHFRKRLPFP